MTSIYFPGDRMLKGGGGYSYGSRATPGSAGAGDGQDDGVRLSLLVPLIVIVLCIFIGVSQRRRQVLPEENQDTQKKQSKIEDPETRKKKVLESFEVNKTTMIVQCSDIQCNPENNVEASEGKIADADTCEQNGDIDLESAVVPGLSDSNCGSNADDSASGNNKSVDITKGVTLAALTDEEHNEDGILLLPRRVAPQKESVPNLCAICLEAYQPGDVVAWSSNPQCCHAFHQDCALHYLAKVKSGRTPCPSCRQSFVNLEQKENVKGDDDEWSC